MRFSSRQESIGDLANAALKKIEARAGQEGEDPRELAREIDRTLGDSVEKTLAISRLLHSS